MSYYSGDCCKLIMCRAEFEKFTVSKAQLSSVMPFLQYELPPRQSGNASGRVQHNFTLLLFYHLFYEFNLTYG